MSYIKQRKYTIKNYLIKPNSIKQLWKNLNIVSSFKENKAINVLSVLNNNNNYYYYVTDPAEISAIFNNYFCNISSNLINCTGVNNTGTFKKYCPSPLVNSMYCELEMEISPPDINPRNKAPLTKAPRIEAPKSDTVGQKPPPPSE